jgi:hypothetical protein
MLYLQVVNLSIVQFTSAHAQVKPGELITYENVAKIKDLVSPGTYYKVDHGMSMKIPAIHSADDGAQQSSRWRSQS